MYKAVPSIFFYLRNEALDSTVVANAATGNNWLRCTYMSRRAVTVVTSPPEHHDIYPDVHEVPVCVTVRVSVH